MLDQCGHDSRFVFHADHEGDLLWQSIRKEVLEKVAWSPEPEAIVRILKARSFGILDCDARWIAGKDVWKLVPGEPVGCRGRPPTGCVRVLSRREYGVFQHLMGLMHDHLIATSRCPVELFQSPASAVTSVAAGDTSTRRLWHLFGHVVRNGVSVMYDSNRGVRIFKPEGVKCPAALWNLNDNGFQNWSNEHATATQLLVEQLRIQRP